ncbi:hypothetical protein SAMN04515667_0480 [Formosa sp. Hel1_31_208]|nr:hypothetical protein SAMN04515667_0480 [Formosa sp. Hel1_31_208]
MNKIISSAKVDLFDEYFIFDSKIHTLLKQIRIYGNEN